MTSARTNGLDGQILLGVQKEYWHPRVKFDLGISMANNTTNFRPIGVLDWPVLDRC
jgi:hypothetical protein